MTGLRRQSPLVVPRLTHTHSCPAVSTLTPTLLSRVRSTGGFVHCGTMWRWMDEVEDVAQRRDLLEEVG